MCILIRKDNWRVDASTVAHSRGSSAAWWCGSDKDWVMCHVPNAWLLVWAECELAEWGSALWRNSEVWAPVVAWFILPEGNSKPVGLWLFFFLPIHRLEVFSTKECTVKMMAFSLLWGLVWAQQLREMTRIAEQAWKLGSRCGGSYWGKYCLLPASTC